MSISRRFVVQSTVALLATGFAMLIAIVGGTIWIGERARLSFDEVIEARDIRGLAVEIGSALRTAESSQRGHVATGNEIYLAPYDRARRQLTRQLGALGETRVRTEEALLLERLAAVVAEKLAEMDESIALASRGDTELALKLLRTNRGKALTDEAEVYLSGVVRAADERLTAAAAAQRANALMLRWVSLAGGLVIIAVVGVLVVTVRRYTAELLFAQGEVSRANATLEERVERRTADLARARERAELLLAEVNHRVANSLSLVAAVVRLQARTSDAAARDVLDETQGRIEAVAMIHRRLYGSADVSAVELDQYLAGLLDQLEKTMRHGGNASLSYELEPLRMEIDASVNLGVVVAEWVTNAFKYAYADARGEVRVRLKRHGPGHGELVVEDDGIGRRGDAPAKGSGLGSRIVAAMASTLKAEVEYFSRTPGTAARLVFPLHPPQRAA